MELEKNLLIVNNLIASGIVLLEDTFNSDVVQFDEDIYITCQYINILSTVNIELKNLRKEYIEQKKITNI